MQSIETAGGSEHIGGRYNGMVSAGGYDQPQYR